MKKKKFVLRYKNVDSSKRNKTYLYLKRVILNIRVVEKKGQKATRTFPDDLSGSPSRVRWCRARVSMTYGSPATAVGDCGAEFCLYFESTIATC